VKCSQFCSLTFLVSSEIRLFRGEESLQRFLDSACEVMAAGGQVEDFLRYQTTKVLGFINWLYAGPVVKDFVYDTENQ